MVNHGTANTRWLGTRAAAREYGGHHSTINTLSRSEKVVGLRGRYRLLPLPAVESCLLSVVIRLRHVRREGKLGRSGVYINTDA